jgi:hypothetical protein
MIFDPFFHGVPLIIMLACAYIFFKVAGFFIKITLTLVILLMFVYLGMALMGVDFEGRLHDFTGWH